MYSINGVRNGAGRDAPVINGGKYGVINGARPHLYDKWGMVWNGNHFAPPEPSSVLWFPGAPGAGSTIQDFAESYSDSAVNTNEILDATETGVDCDIDATTAIPANSVILVESEKMFVTATGTTLTVNRGYANSVAATHATAKDIYVWIPNNGTITGASWVQLPSGVSGFRTDGSDDYVTVTQASSFNFGVASTSRTIKFWTKCLNTVSANNDALFAQAGTGAYIAFRFQYKPSTNVILITLGTDGSDGNPDWERTNTTNLEDKLHHIVFSYTLPAIGGNMSAITSALFVDSVAKTLGDAGTAGTLDASCAAAGNLFVGQLPNNTLRYNGDFYLPLITNTAWALADAGASYNQERHLFGV